MQLWGESVTKHEEVIAFINKFTNNGNRQEVIECFSCGCCYWFAQILEERFRNESIFNHAVMVYDEIINHWACSIRGRIYDITGDITDDKGYKWMVWDNMQYRDKSLYHRLVRDCIRMELREIE